MAHIIADRVRETHSQTGPTAARTLLGAVSGFQAMAAALTVNGDTGWFFETMGADWQVFLGTRTSATVLTVTTVLTSSNGGAAVNWGAGVKDLTGSIPAKFFNEYMAHGYAAQTIAAAQQDQVRANLGLFGKNLLMNSVLAVDPRYQGVESAVADNANFATGWRYIGEATANCKARDTEIGGPHTLNGYIKFTGTTDKGGVMQVVEGLTAKPLRGLSATFSVFTWVSNTRLGNIKMGIAEYTGTENATTGDPISAWGADGTTPTLAANWAWLNTPANLNVTASGARYSVTGTVGASANNLAVVLWNDDKSYTANDTLFFTELELEQGNKMTAFDQPIPALDDLRCLRRLRGIGFATSKRWYGGRSESTASAVFNYNISPPMLAAPTIAMIGAGSITVNDGSVNETVASLGTNYSDKDNVGIVLNTGATLTSTRLIFISVSTTATGLLASAEI